MFLRTDPRGGHNRIYFNTDFFKTWSPNMAYVLGFVYADGAIEDCRKSSRTCYLAITSKDKCILEQIKKVLGSKHRLYKRKPEITMFPNGNYLSKERYVLRIANKAIFNDLLRLGVTPRKSLTITFPIIPLEYLSFFLRGYFDGDGCLHLKNKKYPLVVFTSGSLRFLEGLNLALHKVLGIPLKVTSVNNYGVTTYFQLRYGIQSSNRILKYIYENLEKVPFLRRKFLIYKKYLRVLVKRCALHDNSPSRLKLPVRK